MHQRFIYSIFSNNGGHIFQRKKNLQISSMQDTPRNIYTKFDSNWSSSVRGEDFWKNNIKIAKKMSKKGNNSNLAK